MAKKNKKEILYKDLFHWLVFWESFFVFVVTYGLLLNFVFWIFLKVSFDLLHVLAFGMAYYFLKTEPLEIIEKIRAVNRK